MKIIFISGLLLSLFYNVNGQDATSSITTRGGLSPNIGDCSLRSYVKNNHSQRSVKVTLEYQGANSFCKNSPPPITLVLIPQEEQIAFDNITNTYTVRVVSAVYTDSWKKDNNDPIITFKGVAFFRDANYQGSYEDGFIPVRHVSCFESRTFFNDSDRKIYNDEISSMIIPPGWRVVVWTDCDQKGEAMQFEGNVPFVGEKFNDKISSLKVLMK